MHIPRFAQFFSATLPATALHLPSAPLGSVTFSALLLHTLCLTPTAACLPPPSYSHRSRTLHEPHPYRVNPAPAIHFHYATTLPRYLTVTRLPYAATPQFRAPCYITPWFVLYLLTRLWVYSRRYQHPTSLAAFLSHLRLPYIVPRSFAHAITRVVPHAVNAACTPRTRWIEHLPLGYPATTIPRLTRRLPSPHSVATTPARHIPGETHR